MDGEREFLARVEAADVRQLAELFQNPRPEEERLLRTYFGDQRYRRMRGLALQAGPTRSSGPPPGNVVVLHGMMGGELSRFPSGAAGIPFWLNLWRLAAGEFAYCRLGDDGRSLEHDIRPTGILKRYYGEMLLSLAAGWNVQAFWYDWRKDIRLAASALESQIRAWFGDQPVHLVAHSMGGLVARAFTKEYSPRWKKMADAGAKLIMLGTPNWGSFAAAQVLTGTQEMVRQVARLDLKSSLREVRAIASTFPGCYQMLPSPAVLPAAEVLYDPSTWRHLPDVSTAQLQAARDFQDWLSDAIDPQRMIYIAGYGRPTVDGIEKLDEFAGPDGERTLNAGAYHFTADGDGTVSHELGFLGAGERLLERVYFVDEEHGSLPLNRQVLQAIDDLLRTDQTRALPSQKPLTREARSQTQLQEHWRRSYLDPGTEMPLPRFCAATRGDATATAPVTTSERKLESQMTRSFLFADETRGRGGVTAAAPLDKPQIEIGLVHGSIEGLDYQAVQSDGGAVVDCLAVGHYIGVRPQYAEEALDIALSRELLRRGGQDPPEPLPDRDRVLAQYTDRGILHGQLGQPFFLLDPRPPSDGMQRLIAIAGMGLPGQFGTPELTVLARELCWSLGQLGKRHLATVLIGGGQGNLPPEDAVQAWLQGTARALSGELQRPARRLERITFVERDPGRLRELDSALAAAQAAVRGSLVINYKRLEKTQLDDLYKQAKALQIARLKQSWTPAASGPAADDRDPARITVQLVGETYLFGAITSEASIPERALKIDPRLVESANAELAAATELSEQLQQGRFMERLLIPRDLRNHLCSNRPVVIVVDRSTARLHWELLAQPDPGHAIPRPEAGSDEFRRERFLGTARGLTRQFRSVLAPVPEPPPPPQRVLRILVVANPAADAPLPGAELEGFEVADLIESFNNLLGDKTRNRVEVERLFGPYEATRQNVLKKLMLESWDMLHFAGHCLFNPSDPAASGWVFGMKNREILSANELTRIDRVPKFVFSNACESGLTPDRAEQSDPRLAPSFAEAFFERGVANFVCTAWPVDDGAARAFARRLYAGLLGLQQPEDPRPEPLHRAMCEARCTIGVHGGRTWGAYQHYGNPNYRLFDADSFRS